MILICELNVMLKHMFTAVLRNSCFQNFHKTHPGKHILWSPLLENLQSTSCNFTKEGNHRGYVSEHLKKIFGKAILQNDTRQQPLQI